MPITINGTTGISGVDGSAATPAVQGSDTNTGVFYPAADTVGVATSGTERMRIDSSGNVGIGTSSPDAALTVRSTGANGINLGESLNSSIVSSRLFFSNATAGQSAALYNNTGSLLFATGATPGSSSGTERMRIDSSGNLLVGTTTSTGVSGVGIGFLPGFSTSGVSMVCRTGTAANNDNVYFYTTSGLAGYIRTNGTTTTYASVSDERLKENIANADSAAEKVQQIQVRKFDWKSGDGHVDYGFIAQELNLVAPQAVAEGTEENDVWAVDSSMLVPLLTKAIQEQQALITTLTDRITALEAK